jgi:hypothetical protein
MWSGLWKLALFMWCVEKGEIAKQENIAS